LRGAPLLGDTGVVLEDLRVVAYCFTSDVCRTRETPNAILDIVRSRPGGCNSRVATRQHRINAVTEATNGQKRNA
jgi:hypothetical protein